MGDLNIMFSDIFLIISNVENRVLLKCFLQCAHNEGAHSTEWQGFPADTFEVKPPPRVLLFSC